MTEVYWQDSNLAYSVTFSFTSHPSNLFESFVCLIRTWSYNNIFSVDLRYAWIEAFYLANRSHVTILNQSWNWAKRKSTLIIFCSVGSKPSLFFRLICKYSWRSRCEFQAPPGPLELTASNFNFFAAALKPSQSFTGPSLVQLHMGLSHAWAKRGWQKS